MLSVCIGYFGASLHKGRCLAIGGVTISLGCFIMVLPHLLAGEYQYDPNGASSLCQPGCEWLSFLFICLFSSCTFSDWIFRLSSRFIIFTLFSSFFLFFFFTLCHFVGLLFVQYCYTRVCNLSPVRAIIFSTYKFNKQNFLPVNHSASCGAEESVQSSYLYVFIIGQCLNAVGGAMMYTLAVPFLDNNIDPNQTPVYIGNYYFI